MVKFYRHRFALSLLGTWMGMHSSFADNAPQSISLKVGHLYQYVQEKHPEFIPQIGGYFGSYGKAQLVDVATLNGNWYTLAKGSPNNVLLGANYYLDAYSHPKYKIQAGLDVFYLPKGSVGGNINLEQQEQSENLSYNYSVQNIPLYFAARAKTKELNPYFDLVFDLGIGPNFIRTSNYQQSPLTSYTLSDDQIFSAHNNVSFSAMAGVGTRLYNLLGDLPLECSYRFMYLGQGNLAINDNQLLNTLVTGHNYANTIACGVVI